jgi:mRNA-degrading endonuclease RelE of RelBE toxin-antitoxin system
MKKYKVIFLPSAKKDLRKARAWYKNVNKSLPSRFRMDMNSIVDILQNRPTVFSRRYRDVRVAHLKVFPYGLHYLIDGQNVVVLGVFHTSIDPDKWDERRFKQ